jgi:hypothetical protein
MNQQIRAAGIAALFIFFAFAVHLANIFYFEPQMGFKSLADYMSADQLIVGLKSEPWTWSGYAHFVTGLALAVIAAVLVRWVRQRAPTGTLLVGIAGSLGALAFMLNGIIDLQGRDMLFAYDVRNPGNTQAIVITFAFLRNIVNITALVLLGWCVVQFTWVLRGVGKLPFLFAIFSYVAGLVTFWLFRTPSVYAAAYILLPLWALGFGLTLVTRAESLAQFEEKYV